MPGILDQPVQSFYLMVNFEKVRLEWSSDQVRDFAQNLLGKSNPDQFSPTDWMTLVYALRRCN